MEAQPAYLNQCWPFGDSLLRDVTAGPQRWILRRTPVHTKHSLASLLRFEVIVWCPCSHWKIWLSEGIAHLRAVVYLDFSRLKSTPVEGVGHGREGPTLTVVTQIGGLHRRTDGVFLPVWVQPPALSSGCLFGSHPSYCQNLHYSYHLA